MPGVTLHEWDNTLKKWVRAPAVVPGKRMTATGQVIAGAHKLYWISCNPSAGNSVWELTDDTDGSTEIVLDHYHTTRESHNTNLIPPKQFSTGIYLKTFTAMTSMVFGYV